MKEEFEFENQRPDETIVLVRRRHPWVLFNTGIFVLALAIIVLIAFLVWGASTISVVVLIIALLVAIYKIGVRWFIYSNDIYVLTNQRIINIDQGGFFLRRVSEAELENIQNVTYEIKGPIRSFLNFGDIQISTAGNTVGLLIKNVENPHFVQEKIIAYQKKNTQKRPNDVLIR